MSAGRRFGGRRSSREFFHAILFAMMVADERKSPTLDTPDILAGLYIASLESLWKYWKSPENFTEFVIAECNVGEPRLFYWVSVRAGGPGDQQYRSPSVFKENTPELARIWDRAMEFASGRPKDPSTGGIVFTSEDFLLAIATDGRSEVGQKLAKTGLDVERIREAVKTLRPRPG
jgi:hypothetical protein